MLINDTIMIIALIDIINNGVDISNFAYPK